jgi:sucrose-6-phosphate hydrolase SacC (GH32 family)
VPRIALLLSAAFLTSVASHAAQHGDADFNQPYRPQFHFSPQQHWTNDPNGLVYFEGEYHLFFQYNPFGDLWGHMSWGHAVSRDLIHWRQLPVAIPEENGIMIFTGSTVVDEHNTSGFCTHGHACMVAIYTGFTAKSNGKPSLQTQNIAFSNDRGRTWSKYSGNPVIDLHMSDFRDPKVFWSAQSNQWIMAVSLPNDHKIALYGSPDLKNWKSMSEFGPAGAIAGQWECPELFEVPVEGKAGESRWVLKVGLNPGALQGGSGEQYFIGRFDGREFKNDNPASLTLWTDYGKDCYCALTFNNLPATHTPVMMGWMDNWQYAAKLPTSPWRGQMTLPRKLSLHETADGIRLFQVPVDELQDLASAKLAVSGLTDSKINMAFAATPLNKAHTYRLRSTVNLGKAAEAGWKILVADGTYTLIGYDKQRSIIYVDRTHSGTVAINEDFPARLEAPLALQGPLSFDLIVDRSSVELFADHGAVTMTNLVFPNEGATTIEFYSKGGPTGMISANLTQLKSAH